MVNFRLRFAFSELGRAALLSHLEVQRALMRTIRRADLPFLVSQGFSPHMKFATGPALPVGVASRAEYLDVELGHFVKPAGALVRLQAAAPPLLPVLRCAYVSPQDPSLNSWLNAQTMELVIESSLLKEQDLTTLSAHFESVWTGPALEVMRRDKLRSYLPQDFVQGPLELRQEPGKDAASSFWAARFEMALPAEGALRSDVFVEALIRPLGLALHEVNLTRSALFHRSEDGARHAALPGEDIDG